MQQTVLSAQNSGGRRNSSEKGTKGRTVYDGVCFDLCFSFPVREYDGVSPARQSSVAAYRTLKTT